MKILIIEPDRMVADDIAMFAKNSGHIIGGLAYSLPSGLKLLSKSKVDFVLISIGEFPKDELIEMIRIIRLDYRLPFGFSISSESDIPGFLMDSGAAGFIIKPNIVEMNNPEIL